MSPAAYVYRASGHLRPLLGGANVSFGLPSVLTASASAQVIASAGMIYGVSAGSETNAKVTAQIASVHPNAYFIYLNGATWAEKVPTTIPATSDVFVVFMQTDATQLDTYLDSMPATRAGRVYVMYRQEPENDAAYVTNPALYRAEGSALYAAVDRQRARGRGAYIVKSSCLMPFYGFKKTDATHPAPIGFQQDWIIPGAEHIGFSIYAEFKAAGSSVIWGNDPVVYADRAGACCAAIGLPWGASAWGFALPDAQMTDPTSLANRVFWFNENRAALARNGATHANWFNIRFATSTFQGDYTLEATTGLYAAWKQALAESGQYSGPWP